MNDATPPVTRTRLRVRWSLLDIVLVVVASALATVGLAVVLGIVLAVAGVDRRTYIQAHLVVYGAVIGVLAYGTILLFVYFAIVRRHNLSWAALGFRRPPVLALALAPLIVLAQLVSAAIVNLLVLNVTGGFENPQIKSISGGQGFSWLNFGLMLVLAGVVAPIVEETLFRGLIFGWLRAHLPLFAAIGLSAAIFAAAHVIPILLPALFVVGLILALAYELSGSLWVSILVHALQNTIVVVAIFGALAAGVPLQR